MVDREWDAETIYDIYINIYNLSLTDYFYLWEFGIPQWHIDTLYAPIRGPNHIYTLTDFLLMRFNENFLSIILTAVTTHECHIYTLFGKYQIKREKKKPSL